MTYLWEVNFTELFAKLPTSTLKDWETAARKQLKGKPLESIDISMHEGAIASPYAMGTDTSIQGGGSQDWVQFSSFAACNEVSGAMLLEALNGGAQGVEIDFSELMQVSAELSDVRFDFISLKVNNFAPASQSALVDLIPQAQRAGAKVVVHLSGASQVSDYKELMGAIGGVQFLLSPKLKVGDSSDLSSVLDAAKEQIGACESQEYLLDSVSRLGVEIILSSDYLKNIIYIHSARLLFANIYNAFGISEPLPRPFLFGRISQRADEESHEAYLIDATARAVAGISGGLDALSILPYTDSDQFLAARRARNIQNVLAIEGMLGLPANAVAGAAFFETAAIDLVRSVWADF